jgi:hypothetical protein
VPGFITGIRFYKGSGNVGTHIGYLWSSTGTLLASATFTSETASGWQQVNFSTPVAMAAGTTYIASYLAPNGHYAYDESYFTYSGVDNGVLHALSNGAAGGNGVYVYGSGGFPNQTWAATNYWVDLVFSTSAPPASSGATIWSSTAAPATPSVGDSRSVELGVKFDSDVPGFITGIRFYKGSGNVGTHIGYLWSSTGTLLASATFTSETASGWQQVNFSTPVAITAGTTYIASYLAPNGHYSYDESYFTYSGVDNGVLHALSNTAAGGNGVFLYGSGGFPNQSWDATNYWVDVVFSTSDNTKQRN